MDADRNEIELNVLSQALGGLSRVIAASANFAITNEVSLRRDTQIVRVVSRAPIAGSYGLHTIVQFAHHHPMFREYAVGALSNLTIPLIGFMFFRNARKKEEMKYLSQALQTSIRESGARDQATIDRLADLVEKMAIDLRPAVKRAVAPIGVSARTLTVGAESVAEKIVIDEADKAAIMSPEGLTVDEERTYSVLISELDMQTGACHVAIQTDDEADSRRFAAKITDPVITLEKNPYVMAMASKEALSVKAKATIRDQQIERLYISNLSDRASGEVDFNLD